MTLIGSFLPFAMLKNTFVYIIKEVSTIVNTPYVVRCNLLSYGGQELPFPKQWKGVRRQS